MSTVAIAAACAAAACSDQSIDAPTAFPGAFTVDSAAYVAQPIGYSQVAFRVVARYHNPTSAPVYLDRCTPTAPHPLFAVNLRASAASAYNAAYACVGHDSPIVVAPGETRVDTLRITGPTAFDNSTQRYIGVLEGTYSLMYFASACPPQATTCSATPSVPTESGEFTVKIADGGMIPAVIRDYTPAIQTDSLLYHVRTQNVLYDVRIGLTMFNPLPDTAYIVNCNGATSVYMEKQSGSSWQQVWNPPIAACLSQPIVIPQNGHYIFTLPFEAVPYNMPNAEPRFTDAQIAGIYRLVFTDVVNHYRSFPAPFGPTIPIEYRRSNAFAIVADF